MSRQFYTEKRWKKVTKEEFQEFIKNYPRELVKRDVMAPSLPATSYNDFEIGDYPYSIVAEEIWEGGKGENIWHIPESERYWIMEELEYFEPIPDEDGWIASCVVHDNYIADKRLKNICENILITCETMNRKRYVKKVLCDHGRVCKAVGKIIAWMPLPEPYKGKIG